MGFLAKTAGAVTGSVLMTGLILVPPVQTPAQAQARVTGAAKAGDFNGDGKVEVTAGAPSATIDGTRTGAVAVLNGSHLPGTLITPDGSDPSEIYGTAMASGDFDADGFADLAVGAPGKATDVDGDGFPEPGAGSVTIIYGSRSGLDTRRSQRFSQASPGVPGDPAQGEYFGGSLAAGDFNGDGRADLAIGAVYDQDGRQWDGSITVLSGGTSGLSGTGAQLVTNEVSAYSFGTRLASGDVNGDGVADLVQFADMGAGTRVIGYPGGGSGLDTAASFSKDLPGDFSTVFGSIAVGDLNGDDKADVVVGDPQYASESGGRVALMLSQGSTLADPQVIDQDTAGVPDSGESDDRFGWSLAIGDVNGDGKGDLAIGASGEDIETADANGAGAVTVLRGSPTGITTKGAKWINQDTAGIPDTSEVADLFGYAVSLHDDTGDGRADLVIGAEQESVGDFISAGSVTVLKGVNAKKATEFDLSDLGVTDPSFASLGYALLP
jgi:hypothetical protein